MNKNKELDAHHQMLIHEKTNLLNYKYEAEYKISILEKDLYKTKERCTVMVRKFNDCIDKLKEKIHEERILKGELRKYKLEVEQLKFQRKQQKSLDAPLGVGSIAMI